MLIMALSKEHNIDISALCNILKMPRSSFYYHNRGRQPDEREVFLVKDIFKKSRSNYGARKIRFELFSKHNVRLSRRKIGRIMLFECLFSSYTKPSYRPQKTKSVRTEYPNILKQEFDNRGEREVMVSDTTYIMINGKWHYLCIMVDLCGRYIDGYCASTTKDATLTKRAILSIKGDIRDIGILHSDKGSEYINKLVDKTLRAFNIERSASGTGNPFDNAVAEAMFKIIKTEFVQLRIFKSLEQFNQEFSDWVYWYNNERIHGSLSYMTPTEFRTQKREENEQYIQESQSILKIGTGK